MRLTNKDGTFKEYIYGNDCQTITGVREWNNLLTKKLGQLEDIEEELGIDLITLFKALKDGIYRYGENNQVPVYLTWHDYLKELVLFFDDNNPYNNRCFQFKDYGKTWALTKEELS